MSSVPQFLTTAEAARILDVEPAAIREHLERGNIAGYRQDNTRRTWRIDANSLDEFIQRRDAINQSRAARQSADGSIAIVLNSGAIAYVDAEDADLASLTWTHARNGYAVCNGRNSYVYLHRVIAERAYSTSPDVLQYADHIDRDRMNNRRSNLRIANPSQSTVNRKTKGGAHSGYRGVRYIPNHRKHWAAEIQMEGNRVYLGYFYTANDAARAYNAAAIKMHGEYAVLNEIPE